MTEDNTNNGYDGKGLKGPLWTAASLLIAGVARQYLGPGGFPILGGPVPGGPGAPVTREVLDLTARNQMLESKLYTQELDAKQQVVNATQQAEIKCINDKLSMLFGLTQLTVPNGNLNPGYGPATVVPTPPPVAVQPPAISLDSATITALANAMKAAA